MHIIQELTYRQLQPYGCGLYAISNLFANIDDKSIYCDIKLQESSNGNHMHQLNTWINHHKLYVEPVYFNSFEYLDKEHRLPKKDFNMKTTDDGFYLPMLIEGRRNISEKSKYHLISGLCDHKGDVFIYDSLLMSPYWTTFKKLTDGTEFYHLRGVWLFCHQDDGSWATFDFTKSNG